MPTLEEEYKQYQGAQGVNDMYEAQKKSQLAGLESAYQQNLSSAQAARDAIPRQYQERANDLAVQYERNRRNLNQQANANGLNTGAGSQMQLALGSNYQRDYGGIRTAQQQAIDQADKGIRDLQAAYNSSVQQAVADNDFRRTQALLADYQQRYQQQLQTAQNLAQWGDFSGYNGIPGYSSEAITNMQSAWQASNPDLAYRTGRITAEQYYQMTGKYPAGYQAPGATYTGPGQTPPPKGPPLDPDAAKKARDIAQTRGKAMTDYYRDENGKVRAGLENDLASITRDVRSAAVQQAANTMTQDQYFNWLVQNGLATQAEVDKAKNGG
jgi:hypothetical protein